MPPDLAFLQQQQAHPFMHVMNQIQVTFAFYPIISCSFNALILKITNETFTRMSVTFLLF